MKENGTETAEPLVKKRRKTAAQLNTSPPVQVKVEDVYKSVCDWEEKEAADRNPELDRKLFHETCNSFRTYMEEIAVLKKGYTRGVAKATIMDKCSEACLLFVMLRKLNRLEKLRLKQSREELHKVKSQVDSQHLQLQNLLYEVLHLQKEVTKCLQFKSQDEEIDLVPVEEFLKEAPEPLLESAKNQDAHQLQKARLEWELQQRRQLSELCKQMHGDKEKVSSDIEKQQQHLDNLAPMLRNILQATKPVEESLGVKVEETRHQHHLAYLLPQPLFFLYVQADAQHQASDPLLSVSILGDEEDAQRIKDGENQANEEDDSDSDQELEVETSTKSKRHHRKRASKVDRLEERRKRLLAKHPLNVTLTVSLKDGSKVKVEFSYLMNLCVVTVKCYVHLSEPVTGVFASQLITPESIFCSLYPQDTGLESPNVSNHYQLQNVGLGSFADLNAQLGYPYIWAQRVAGLDFISSSTQGKSSTSTALQAKLDVSQASISTTVAALRKRFVARLALSRQVQSLETGVLPPIPALHDNFPSKISSQVQSLKCISWEEYCSNKCTKWFRDLQQVAELDTVYRMAISRGPARATAFIAIKSNYPESPPLFSIEVDWKGRHTGADCGAIRDMEQEVNVYYKELMVGQGWIQTLLVAQVTRILYCFDIFLEANAETDEEKRLFPRDKVFIQGTWGRTRALPFKYLSQGGRFTQR